MPESRGRVSEVATPSLLRVAHVRRVHGVRGEVRVQPLGGGPGRFAPGTSLIGERDRRTLTVLSARPLDGDEVLLAFEQLPTREQAAGLTGDYLCVEPSHARELGPDEWFIWQLVGLRVLSTDGDDLGTVRDVEEQPAADVLVVSSGESEVRYPLVREWVRSIDVAGGAVVVSPWPEDDA